jgi:hypothetical protein
VKSESSPSRSLYSRHRLLFHLCAAIALAALYVCTAASTRGLVRTVYGGIDERAPVLARRLTSYVGTDSLREDPDFPRTALRITWAGIWYVPNAGRYEIRAQADDDVSLSIDGRPVIREGTGSRPVFITLDKGPHGLTIEYVPIHGANQFSLRWSADGSPRPFGQAYLYPSRRAVGWHGPLVALGWLALGAWIALPFVTLIARRRPEETSRVQDLKRRTFALSPAVRSSLVTAVVLYAALLRLDAVVSTRGVVAGPRWLEGVQRHVQTIAAVIKPTGLALEPEPYPVGADPYDSLQQAREMSSPYTANFREPLFAFATKVTLGLVGQDDLAVCLTSTFFSVLAVYATYLLGSLAFSPFVGILAGATLAIERDVIYWGAAGWRDDMFTSVVLLSAYTCLRLSRAPNAGRSLIAGAVGAVACLVRLTSVSFILPSLVYGCLSSGLHGCKARLKWLLLSGAVMSILVAPFLVNCWVRFGDPLYPINGLTRFYAQSTDVRATERQAWLPWLAGQGSRSPVRLTDTIVVGSTLYPFDAKWRGFDAWSGPLFPLADWLPALAILGLILWWLSPNGRFLLLVLATAHAPFVFTAGTPALHDFRHTVHTYPFYLIAAAYAVAEIGAEVRKISMGRRVLPTLRRVAVVLLLGGLGWSVMCLLPYFRMREDLRSGQGTAVVAGPRNWLFFRNDWYRPITVENVTARFAKGRRATVQIPMTGNGPYVLTLRVDPFSYEGVPQQVMAVRLNDAMLGTFPLVLDPERVGQYTVVVPASIARNGLNRLELAVASSILRRSVRLPGPGNGFDSLVSLDQDVAFRLWYVLIRPQATLGSSGR